MALESRWMLGMAEDVFGDLVAWSLLLFGVVFALGALGRRGGAKPLCSVPAVDVLLVGDDERAAAGSGLGRTASVPPGIGS
jgi:hypothetical protein